MRTARPDRFATTVLRGDLPAASALAVVLLLVQLFIAGLGAGEAFAGPRERHLCAAASRADAAHRTSEDHGQTCPCLAAGCCFAPAAGPVPDGASLDVAPPAPVGVSRPLAGFPDPERRPLALFARAGRGPPLAA